VFSQIVAEGRGQEFQFVDRMLRFKARIGTSILRMYAAEANTNHNDCAAGLVDRASQVAFHNNRAFVELRERSIARIMNHRASKPVLVLLGASISCFGQMNDLVDVHVG